MKCPHCGEEIPSGITRIPIDHKAEEMATYLRERFPENTSHAQGVENQLYVEDLDGLSSYGMKIMSVSADVCEPLVSNSIDK